MDSLKKLGMPGFYPLQQASGKMQPRPDLRVINQRVDKGTICVLVSLFVNVIEIADRLMRVNHQCECDLVQLATSAGFNTGPLRQRSLKAIQLG